MVRAVPADTTVARDLRALHAAPDDRAAPGESLIERFAGTMPEVFMRLLVFISSAVIGAVIRAA